MDKENCCICKKEARQRKLILKLNSANSAIQEQYVCLCEQCFYRIPEALRKRLIWNADNHNGEEYNSLIIHALKNTSSLLKLNYGYCLLFDGNSPIFMKVKTLGKLRKAASGVKICMAFENGIRILEKELDIKNTN